jgi:hypothetical protein
MLDDGDGGAALRSLDEVSAGIRRAHAALEAGPASRMAYLLGEDPVAVARVMGAD